MTTTTTKARRDARVSAALGHHAATEVGAPALAVLAGLARREARRIPPTLAQSVTADDIAQDAAVRLLSRQDGALTLAALTSASTAARHAARRNAERAVRSLVFAAIRAGTTPDHPAGPALTAETTGPLAYRAGAERDAVDAALLADEQVARRDGDPGRGVALTAARTAGRGVTIRAARRAGVTDAATLDAIGETGASHAARAQSRRGATWAPVQEQTTVRYVRIIREQSLETMLTATLRTGLPREHRDADTAGRTLAGILADHDTAARWRESFASALTRHALTIRDDAGKAHRGGTQLAHAVHGLHGRDWHAFAARTVRDAGTASDAATVARDAADAAHAHAQEHRGKGTAAAARTAATAALAAERHAAHALAVAHVAHQASHAGRVTLADLAYWSLATSAENLRTGAGRRRATTGTADRSSLSTAVLLAVLGLDTATGGNAAARLRAVLADAASDALDNL